MLLRLLYPFGVYKVVAEHHRLKLSESEC